MAIQLDKSIAKCCVCGRTLTKPESVRAGIGPICAANILNSQPGTDGIYLIDDRRIVTEDELIELAAPIIETHPEFKELRKRLLKHPRYRVMRIRSHVKNLPSGHPTLLRWIYTEDTI